MTTIYQITDTHVMLESDSVAKRNFTTLMTYIAEHPADLLLITGDLPGVDGAADVYEWMKAQLPVGQKTHVIPGNHDDDANLYSVFGEQICGNEEFLFIIELEEIDLILSNTGSGMFPDEQLAFLKQPKIRKDSILFTHYPTKKISTGFMDINYPLGNIKKTDMAIRQSNIDHVFCGHFHTDYTIVDGYALNVTPSPAFCVDLDEKEPKITPPRIPLRKIEITGTQTTSSVIYLDNLENSCEVPVKGSD
jgi:3',5'-cyclic AMP phosphodiesterase CpdA